MKTSTTQVPDQLDASSRNKAPSSQWKIEALGIFLLAGMVVYFLNLSWKKWSDPLIDGYVWYNAWQLSQGAKLYQDIPLVYGPLAAYFDATLFKIFGPGMMVLVTAHLVIYGIILTLIYLAFRMAWGRLGAFAASAVFISVFSFSQLQQCGNFNFAAPYSHEIVHGMLVVLIGTFAATRWSCERSPAMALLLGLCGGLATVLKPEFMLATGVLGLGVIFVRWFYKKPLSLKELFLAASGVIIPTLAFATWFAQTTPWKTAFANASQAWWQVVFTSAHRGAAMQQNAAGLNDPWVNAISELSATASAVIVIGSIWLIGWTFNRPWPAAKRAAVIFAAGLVIYAVSLPNSWFDVGFCLPGLVAILFFIITRQLRRERVETEPRQNTLMALMLVLVAGAMLARMFLQARIYDFGFYQAAFAGMVVSAAMVIGLPRWIGAGTKGGQLALGGSILLIAIGCISIAADSRRVRLAQSHPVGSGPDRFYAFNPNFDPTGALADWVIKELNAEPSNSKVLVLPEGAMINYISRRKHPLPFWITLDGGSTPEAVNQIIRHLDQSPPDVIVLISRSMSEHGLTQFGAPGTPGGKTLQWISDNYQVVANKGGNPLAPKEKGAFILRPKQNANSAEKTKQGSGI